MNFFLKGFEKCYSSQQLPQLNFILIQGVDNQGNQGNHGKIRDLYNFGKVMEKSENFIKISPNQGILHFYLFNVAKKSPKRRYQKEEARGEGNETKFKKKKKTKIGVKRVKRKKKK